MFDQLSFVGCRMNNKMVAQFEKDFGNQIIDKGFFMWLNVMNGENNGFFSKLETKTNDYIDEC